MKALFRSALIQSALAYLFAAYMRLSISTMRWTHIDRERAQGVWKSEGGAMLCLWHDRISLSPASWPKEAQECRALISLSADGEFIAKAMALVGFPAIRGSSQKKSDSAKSKGGMAAFRDMAKWINSGGAVAITPDGPRGPAHLMAEGTPMLARLTGAPVLFVGLACSPCIRLGSWDKAVLPIPFGKAAMVWDGPFQLDGKIDAAALALDWAARLTAVTERAEALVK